MSSTVTKSPDRRRPLQPPIAHDLVLLCTRQHAPGTRRPPADRGAAWWMDAACLTSETRSEASPGSRFPRRTCSQEICQPDGVDRRFNMTREWQVSFWVLQTGQCGDTVHRAAQTSLPYQKLYSSVGILGDILCVMIAGCNLEQSHLPPHHTEYILSEKGGRGGILPGQRGFRILPDNNSGLA